MSIFNAFWLSKINQYTRRIDYTDVPHININLRRIDLEKTWVKLEFRFNNVDGQISLYICLELTQIQESF